MDVVCLVFACHGGFKRGLSKDCYSVCAGNKGRAWRRAGLVCQTGTSIPLDALGGWGGAMQGCEFHRSPIQPARGRIVRVLLFLNLDM